MRQSINISRPIHIPNPHANIDVLYGPYNSVAEALETIPKVIRELGLTVGVIYNGSIIEYQWKSGIEDSDLVIKQEQVTKSVPVYTTKMVEELHPQGDYVSISDDTDLDKEIKNKTYYTSENGQLANILFSALRQLQAEVAMLKNSFKYGINSYKDKDTAFSGVLEDYFTDIEDEPLWTIDPEALSLIEEVPMTNEHTLNGRVIVDKKTLRIDRIGIWESDRVNDNADPKLIFYVTASNNNVTFDFTNVYVHINEITNNSSPQSIMLILNRKVEGKGKNYIYVTIDNILEDKNIIKGYYNPTTNSLQEFVYELEEEPIFNQISFENITLSHLAAYSKYQDFSGEIIPSKPNEEYKLDVAHITIRSVQTYQMLEEIAKYLQEAELVYCKANKRLYIIDDGKIQNIGTKSSEPESGMTESELLEKLSKMGIVSLENGDLSLSKIADITLINEDIGDSYKYYIDAYGELQHKKVIPNEQKLAFKLQGKILPDPNIRGFVANLKKLEKNISTKLNQDYRLNSDRIKIGSVYAPLDTDIIHGCSHGFIELENTSEEDFELEGCYLHCAKNFPGIGDKVYHLPLTGTLPAGGTYLIRCKQYSNFDDVNTFIKVKSFDQEWYVDGELLDLTINQNETKLGLALTYGNSFNGGELTATTVLVASLVKADPVIPDDYKDSFGKFVYKCNKYFIDGVYINEAYTNSNKAGYWACGNNPVIATESNSIYKNTFELDPAKQAFQSLTTIDSSRSRWQNGKTDYQQLSLNKEYISFPNSEDIYPISYFTPKASFEHKNVCTDKSKLDLNKPNMVTCSFGINIYTTRCFNWISAGLFDEYVFYKKQGTSTWTRVASYGEVDSTGKRKSFSNEIEEIIYNRITGRFPANNTLFTSHKCIIDFDAVQTPTQYTYKVGRSTKDGQPDLEHCSEDYTFTLYPTSYKPTIIQVTDQQGFHWVEYQVWAAVAIQLNELINSMTNTIPILINTGDMTQNGTRINEWLDYYNAGKCLFNHLEQMNVVGNNDLCGTNPYILGTGDDVGKSNSFYFHLFYCYEINPEIPPIVNGKYIPSLYYFDSVDRRYLMVNSEITQENCINWFGLTSNGIPVNIYTGFTFTEDNNSQSYVAEELSFTPIYNQLYQICSEAGAKKITAACHELPFTVITRESLSPSKGKNKFRNLSNSDALVGSHLNQIHKNDNKKGIYWFSRLMEYFDVSLIIGGHKHTYACTYPLRENYKYTYHAGTSEPKISNKTYTDGEELTSLTDGPMKMYSSLQNDDIQFIDGEKNLTKFPLTKRTSVGTENSDEFFPYTPVEDLSGGIIYFMCQASGYKLTSNKELPSANQKFSQIIPQTTVSSTTVDGEEVKTDKAAANQKYPMFAIITQTNDNKNNIKLLRVHGILGDSSGFSQINYGESNPSFQYLTLNNTDNYGTWTSTDSYLLENI